MTVAVVMLAISAAPARAQDPPNCGGNRFQVDLVKDRTYVRDGDTINYTVTLRNDLPGACVVSNITVLFQLPGPDGKPSTTAQTLTQNATFTEKQTEISFGPFAYTVHYGTAMPDRWTARVSVTDGKLHDIPAPYSELNIERTVQSLPFVPALTIDKTGSTTGGVAPQTVTYTYAVRNTSVSSTINLKNVAPTDDRCSPLTYVSGDTNGDQLLQVGETWMYTCGPTTFSTAGSYTNTAVVCADTALPPGAPTAHVCSPPDTWTVTVTPPPPSTPRPRRRPRSKLPPRWSSPQRPTPASSLRNRCRCAPRSSRRCACRSIAAPRA